MSYATGQQQEQYRARTQRVLGLALIGIEALAIGYLSRDVLFPVLVVAVAVVGVFSRFRFDMDRQRTYDVIAIVGLLFVVKYMFAPDNPRYLGLFASQQIAITVAQYVFTLQALQFFVQRRDDRLPFILPGIGVIALVCAAIIQVDSTERRVFQMMCVAFSMLAALYCDASRRFVVTGTRRSVGRPVVTGITLLVVGCTAWYTATFFYVYEREMDHFVRRYLMTRRAASSIGFSESAELGSVSMRKNAASDQVAMRIVSTTAPGYFRARAYDLFDGRKWLMVPEGKKHGPARSRPGLDRATHAGQWFRVDSTTSPGEWRLQVWPGESLNGSYAVPLRTEWLHASAEVITSDAHRIIRSADALAGTPYSILVSQSGSVPPQKLDTGNQEFTDRLTEPPKWAMDQNEISELADSVFDGCQTDRDRITAVANYFRSNYDYSLQVSVPIEWQKTPVAWFLLERPPAHCEYFASGAATLLRLGGVRCRYVTGFVVHEKNQFGAEWVARNQDAHAWVEAWDDQSGWVTVEATPSGGVPSESDASASSQFGEYLSHRLQSLRVHWQQQGIRGLLSSFFESWGGLVIGLIAVLVAVSILRRYVTFSRGERMRSVDPKNESLRKLLVQMDRIVAQFGRKRVPSQTVEQFAVQLESSAVDEDDVQKMAATWYRRYSNLRFGRETVEDEKEVLLNETLRIRTRLKQRSRSRVNRQHGN